MAGEIAPFASVGTLLMAVMRWVRSMLTNSPTLGQEPGQLRTSLRRLVSGTLLASACCPASRRCAG